MLDWKLNWWKQTSDDLYALERMYAAAVLQAHLQGQKFPLPQPEKCSSTKSIGNYNWIFKWREKQLHWTEK